MSTRSIPATGRLASALLSPIQIHSPSLSYSSTTCSTLSTDNEVDGSDNTITRRSSSGGLLSPEVEMTSTGGRTTAGGLPGDSEQDGFYLLKKDSQRRTTLCRVLGQDGSKICDQWMLSIRQYLGFTLLTMPHLLRLMGALKEYIMEQNRDGLERAITTLTEELDFDSAAINQLHLAIYMFQEAVNLILRSHSIKPHWMFALDNLVRNAVQAAITILSPELGANLAGQEHSRGVGEVAGGSPKGVLPGREECNTSGINSVRSNNTTNSFIRGAFTDNQAIQQLRADNSRLVQEMIESQQAYQVLLKQILEEHKQNVQLMTDICQQMTKLDKNIKTTDSLPASSCSDDTGYAPEVDEKLLHWLKERGINEQAVKTITQEEYTFEDFIGHIQRDDLRRMHLRGGVELRIWRAVVEHRYLNDIKKDDNTDRRGSGSDIDTDPASTMVFVECQRCSSIDTAPLTANGPTNLAVMVDGLSPEQVNGIQDESGEDYSGSGIINL